MLKGIRIKKKFQIELNVNILYISGREFDRTIDKNVLECCRNFNTDLKIVKI